MDDQILLTTTTCQQDVVIDHTGTSVVTDALLVTTARDHYLATYTTKHTPSAAYWATEHIWVYTDALNPGHTTPTSQTRDSGPTSWLDHVHPEGPTPPVRRPRPARDTLPLTGRTLRLQAQRGHWDWWVTVSEPFHHGDDIHVRALPEAAYWLAQARPDLAVEHVRTWPIHRLFVYA